jgi:hypothetical protein
VTRQKRVGQYAWLLIVAIIGSFIWLKAEYKNTTELLAAKKGDMPRTAAEHGARNVRVFGSVARGEATAEAMWPPGRQRSAFRFCAKGSLMH